jgi:hypothetical protein
METKQRSSQRFCRCGHARALTQFGLRHICGVSSCECVKHDTAVTPKKAKLTVVEPSPNDGASWERAIALLAQGVINISEGLTVIEKDSPVFKAMLTLIERDLAIKTGRAKLPHSWKASAAHLAGYEVIS